MLNEKQLAQQLNKMKIAPRAEWKAANRELLISQIYGSYESAQKESIDTSVRLSFKDFFYVLNLNRVTQPIAVMALAVFVTVFGGAFSILAAKGSHPGQPLYAVKRATEKTQILLTTDQKEKAALSLQFAANRAEEIDEVLQQNDIESKTADNKVVELKDDLKAEISQAKIHLERMGVVAKKPTPDKDDQPASLQSTTSSADSGDEDGEVFAVNSGKDDKGMQVSQPDAQSAPQDTRSIIEEVKQMVGDNDIAGAIDKLNQVGVSMEEKPSEAKAAETKATGTIESEEEATSTK